MNGSSYLALQAWFTTLFTLALNALIDLLPSIALLKQVSPGIAVGLSHVVILVIAAIGIPSLNDVRLNRQIKVAKKHILQCLSQPGLSKEKQDEYNEMLADLDYQIIKSHNVKIKEIQDDKEHAE